MNDIQEQCAGCKKFFPKDELIPEERTHDDKPAGTFLWCEDCLLKEIGDWTGSSGKKEMHIKLAYKKGDNMKGAKGQSETTQSS
jgi:hypothetical protein